MTKKQTKIVAHPTAATVRINSNISLKLKRWCKKYNLTQGEVVEKMLDFFEATGYDITDTESAATAMGKISKNLAEQMAELRKQTKTETTDLLKKMTEKTEALQKSFDKNTKKIDGFIKEDKKAYDGIWAAKTLFSKHSDEVLKALSGIRDDLTGSAAVQRQVAEDTAKAVADVGALKETVNVMSTPPASGGHVLQPQGATPRQQKYVGEPTRIGKIFKWGGEQIQFADIYKHQNGKFYGLKYTYNGRDYKYIKDEEEYDTFMELVKHIFKTEIQ